MRGGEGGEGEEGVEPDRLASSPSSSLIKWRALLSGSSIVVPPKGGEGGEEPHDSVRVTPGAGDGRSAAAAGSPAAPPTPHATMGRPTTAQA